MAVFPWQREAVLILAVWLMTLGRGWGVFRALAILGLLAGGLWLLRLGGSDPYDPRVWLQWVAVLHFVVAMAVTVAGIPKTRLAVSQDGIDHAGS